MPSPLCLTEGGGPDHHRADGEASVICLEQELDGRRLLEAVAQLQTGALIAQVVRVQPTPALMGPGAFRL